MRNLFNEPDVAVLLRKIDKLTPASKEEWGGMNISQKLAHCHISMETARGKHNMSRAFIGRIIGPIIKKQVLGDKPFRKNSPTDKSYIFPDNLDFEVQKAKAKASIVMFFEGGATKCTRHPHPFFGKLSPEEWAIFQWKHLDHHLRQFGV